MIIKKEIVIDFAHRLINHKGLCKNLHGHRYKFVVAVEGTPIQNKGVANEGMVVDFKVLKQVMSDVIEKPLDHSCVITKRDPYYSLFHQMFMHGMKIVFVPYISTAENMATDLGFKLKFELFKKGITLHSLEVYETPTSVAIAMAKDMHYIEEE